MPQEIGVTSTFAGLPWELELHKFYLANPHLCKSCQCHEDSLSSCPGLNYTELWGRYKPGIPRDTVNSVNLHSWRQWAQEETDLQLCSTAIALCQGALSRQTSIKFHRVATTDTDEIIYSDPHLNMITHDLFVSSPYLHQLDNMVARVSLSFWPWTSTCGDMTQTGLVPPSLKYPVRSFHALLARLDCSKPRISDCTVLASLWLQSHCLWLPCKSLSMLNTI